jgi:hypothetical protein
MEHMLKGSQKQSDGISNHLLAFLLSLSIQPISNHYPSPPPGLVTNDLINDATMMLL